MMIIFQSRPCGVALTRKLHRSFLLRHESANYKHVQHRRLLPSSEPPRRVNDLEEQVGRRSYTSCRLAEISNTNCDLFRQDHDMLQISPNWQRLNSGITKRSTLRQSERKNLNRWSSLVQFSQYSYKISSGRNKVSSSDASCFLSEKKAETRANVDILQSMDASALLDPLSFCKGSTKSSRSMKHGSRNGNDAARRLLRGRKDLLIAARKLNNAPILLRGHGVPPALFQHCVDMADALLRNYGPDVVECSFNNHRTKNMAISKEPRYVRVRRRNAKYSCMPPPSVVETSRSCGKDCDEYDIKDEIDWDHNLTLYLTVMERLAKRLGQVIAPLKKGNLTKNFLCCEKNDRNELHDKDSDGFNLYALKSSPQPLWNVDILRGSYFEFEHIFEKVGSTDNSDSNHIHPFPVVEFCQQRSPDSCGHVLIRLQGYPIANKEFDTTQIQEKQPVTLVFDACVKPYDDCC